MHRAPRFASRHSREGAGIGRNAGEIYPNLVAATGWASEQANMFVSPSQPPLLITFCGRHTRSGLAALMFSSPSISAALANLVESFALLLGPPPWTTSARASDAPRYSVDALPECVVSTPSYLGRGREPVMQICAAASLLRYVCHTPRLAASLSPARNTRVAHPCRAP